MKKFKEQNGSISAIVLATLLLFVIILSGTYMINANVRKAQIKNQIMLKNEYGKLINDTTELKRIASYYNNSLNYMYNETFLYTGYCQTYTIEKAGTYEIECWGASGGGSRTNGTFKENTTGKGGYTSGLIKFNESDVGKKLYIYVGGKGKDAEVGKDSAGGWNGGGLGTWDGHDGRW